MSQFEPVPFEPIDPGVGVRLTLAELDGLPADDEVDLDSIVELWAPRRFPAFLSHRRSETSGAHGSSGQTKGERP